MVAVERVTTTATATDTSTAPRRHRSATATAPLRDGDSDTGWSPPVGWGGEDRARAQLAIESGASPAPVESRRRAVSVRLHGVARVEIDDPDFAH
jgi:hypothetical protein